MYLRDLLLCDTGKFWWCQICGFPTREEKKKSWQERWRNDDDRSSLKPSPSDYRPRCLANLIHHHVHMITYLFKKLNSVQNTRSWGGLMQASWNSDLNVGTRRAWSVFHGESPWIFFFCHTKLASLVCAIVSAEVHGTDPLAHRLSRVARHRNVWIYLFFQSTDQYGEPTHEGTPPPPSRGYFSLCITIYRRKNQNCKKYGAWELSSPDSFGGGAREDPLAHRLSRVARHQNVFFFPTHR